MPHPHAPASKYKDPFAKRGRKERKVAKGSFPITKKTGAQFGEHERAGQGVARRTIRRAKRLGVGASDIAKLRKGGITGGEARVYRGLLGAAKATGQTARGPFSGAAQAERRKALVSRNRAKRAEYKQVKGGFGGSSYTRKSRRRK